ncbi:MAG: LysR family transcriptional regulator [Mycobacteriales bacterium]
MDLRLLRYFVAAAEELHLGNAAARLRISKPTLSQQIRVLERRLDVRLFERSSRSVVLTSAGLVLLEHAREVLAMTDRLEAAVAAARHGERALDVRLVNGTAHVLAAAIEQVAADPTFTVHFSVTSSVDAEEAVVSGRADAALVWGTSGVHTTLHADPIADAEVCLAVSDQHRLAGLAQVNVTDLAEEKIALFPRREAPGTWDVFADHLLPGRRRPGQILEELAPLSPMLGMLRTAQAGRAVAPFVRAVAEAVHLDGLRLLPLDPPLHLTVQLVYRAPHRADLQRLATALADAAAPEGTSTGLPQATPLLP